MRPPVVVLTRARRHPAKRLSETSSPADRSSVLRSSVAALTLFLCGVAPAVALADGPYEPNETAMMATTPVTAPQIDAGIETPQDVDWYLLQPQGVRQVGVLVTLATPCPSSYGYLTVKLIDGEGTPYLPLANLSVGHDYMNPSTARTVDSASFTSQVGHRYFLRVSSNSDCVGATYSIALAPRGALGMMLAPTSECAASRQKAVTARVMLRRYQAARRRARGARRGQLGTKIQLQQQQVTQATADAAGVCTRQPLTGSGWE